MTRQILALHIGKVPMISGSDRKEFVSKRK